MQATATHANEQRPVGLARIRAHAQIGVERVGNNGQHRDEALAFAFPSHLQVCRLRVHGRQIAAVKGEGFANAKPAAPQQQQQRPIARQDPGRC